MPVTGRELARDGKGLGGGAIGFGREPMNIVIYTDDIPTAQRSVESVLLSNQIRPAAYPVAKGAAVDRDPSKRSLATWSKRSRTVENGPHSRRRSGIRTRGGTRYLVERPALRQVQIKAFVAEEQAAKVLRELNAVRMRQVVSQAPASEDKLIARLPRKAPQVRKRTEGIAADVPGPAHRAASRKARARAKRAPAIPPKAPEPVQPEPVKERRVGQEDNRPEQLGGDPGVHPLAEKVGEKTARGKDQVAKRVAETAAHVRPPGAQARQLPPTRPGAVQAVAKEKADVLDRTAGTVGLGHTARKDDLERQAHRRKPKADLGRAVHRATRAAQSPSSQAVSQPTTQLARHRAVANIRQLVVTLNLRLSGGPHARAMPRAVLRPKAKTQPSTSTVPHASQRKEVKSNARE